ncbi:WD40 repeat domain-containing serine/threonine protein kinase [Enhygromyxa salina]|uniref:Serine/threonine-protein kinase PK-1 n=1 Tax=Enhygromyxa salina TaxID=215803 RepID=A0A2S9YY80_9BACT|nr:protein kinase [Enhygromyxa salina]PRQ10019.1 Serine/threonine-protein kinase PK-1 [Enhygromyxa salina]
MDEGTLDGADDSNSLLSDLSSGPETLVTSGGEEGRSSRGRVDYSDDPSRIDRFVILRRIGEGGMGVVYAGYDNELERRLAIKLVHVTRARGDSQARIRREAQAMARLSHPNVVHVYEVGVHEEQVFVAMEFVTGPTLAAWTREQPPSPTRWRTVLDRYIDAGRGLAAAHAAHIVHRDFKPANAIVGDDGRVRVLDFGIARAPEADASVDPQAEAETQPATREPTPGAAQELGVQQLGLEVTAAAADSRRTIDPLSTPLTLTGALVGTPAYMSPEQFEHGPVDARSDQFSFCVALYEALYGERPFGGDNAAALMLNVISGQLRPVPPRAEVPAWVRDVVLRGLAVKPAARWPTMDDLLVALSRDPDARRRRRRRKTSFISLSLVAIVSLGVFASDQMHAAAQAELASAEAQRQEALAQAHQAQAQAERDLALIEAQASAVRARDTARVLAARGLDREPAVAAALLRDVEHTATTPGWRSAAVNALQRPLSERVLRGHEARVVYIDASRDGKWIASAGFDGSARLWPTDGGPPTVLRHEHDVISVSFDRQSQRVVTASRDKTAAVWQLPEPTADGSPAPAPTPLILRGHDEVLWSANFSPDGTKVVTSSRDCTARVWSLDAPDSPIVYRVTDHIVWWSEFSPDGRWIVTTGGDGSVKVWSVDEPKRPPIVLEGHTDRVGGAHFDGSMSLIVTASDDGTARLFRFDQRATAPIQAHAVLQHDGAVNRARFSAENLRVVTVSHDQTAKVWTLDDLGNLSQPPKVLDTKSGPVHSADFSPDGRFLALGVNAGVVQVWPLQGGPMLPLIGHSADVFRVRYSRDGRHLYSGSSDGTVRVWNTDWQQVARQLDGHQADITALERRGKVLVSGSRDGTVRVWGVDDPGPAPAVTTRPSVIDGHVGRVVVSLDAFPRLLASADDEHEHVRLWRVTGEWVMQPDRPLATLPTHGGSLRSVDLDGEGELLAGATLDGDILLWSVAWQLKMVGTQAGSLDPRAPELTPIVLGRHDFKLRTMTLVEFSPDNQILASAGGDGVINLWDRPALLSATAGGPVPATTRLATDGGRIHRISFSHDNRQVASASNDHRVRVWSLASPDAAPLVLEHAYMVNAVDFDPSGRRLVTACSDTNAYLWDLDHPDEPLLLSGAAAEIRDAEFSPDGQLIVAISLDGSLRVWPTSGGEPIVLEAGFGLQEIEFVDAGRRVAAAGLSARLPIWYLGDVLDTDSLQSRLTQATQLCLSPEQRMRFVGESLEVATQAHTACAASWVALPP